MLNIIFNLHYLISFSICCISFLICTYGECAAYIHLGYLRYLVKLSGIFTLTDKFREFSIMLISLLKMCTTAYYFQFVHLSIFSLQQSLLTTADHDPIQHLKI